MANTETAYREPLTIQRLREIKPGERVVYYRGRLPHDVNDARWYAQQCARDDVAARVLEQVCEFACNLQINGRAHLTETLVSVSRGRHKATATHRDLIPTVIKEYAAVGI